ncbi:TPA: AAA family ATPase [Escherichia coli]|nr:AAA family ATPase [Escherichia coli]
MKLISVWSPCGGAGKTTLSLLLAASLKSRGYKTALIDLTENNDANDLSQIGNLNFTVFNSETMSDKEKKSLNSMDFTIVDYDIETEVMNDSAIVVVPVRPSVFNMKKLNDHMEDLSDFPVLPVFNLVESARKEHQNFYESKSDWATLKNRAIYERMIENGCTVFSDKAQDWASVKPAMNEVDLIVDLLLYKLEGKLPESKERTIKLKEKLGSLS